MACKETASGKHRPKPTNRSSKGLRSSPTANRRRRLLGRASPERGGVARRRRRGSPAGRGGPKAPGPSAEGPHAQGSPVYPLRPPGEPYGKENRLSLTLCPPGLPGRRSRAAQALVAPAGAKLPRTAITTAGLVFLAQALPFCCRPSGRGFGQLLLGEDGGYGGLVGALRGSANRGRG